MTIATLLHKEMDRREFLLYTLMLLLLLTGISGMIHNLMRTNRFGFHPDRPKGFGTGNYGGIEKK